jgi:hypothetical protein
MRGFDLGQPAKDSERPFGHTLGKGGLGDQGCDVRVGADDDVVATAYQCPRAGDPAPERLFDLQFPSRKGRRARRVRISSTSAPASMRGPQGHVAGNAGEAMEPGDRARRALSRSEFSPVWLTLRRPGYG